MRKPILLLALLLFCPPVQAQQRPKLKIEGIQVGFSESVSRTEDSRMLFRAGAWTPVFVDISAGKEGLKGNEGLMQVAIETPDDKPETTVYQVVRPLPVLPPGQSFRVLLYTKTANTGSRITAIVRLADGSGTSATADVGGMPSHDPLYLLIGSDMADLRQAVRSAKLPGMNEDGGGNMLPESVAVADSIDELPDQWFGYEAVDLAVLSTSRREFLDALAADPRRREALAQWVARGGKLIVSVGKNQDALAGMAELESLLPVRLAGVEQRTELDLGNFTQAGVMPGPVEVARLEAKPERASRRLIPAEEAAKPLVVQGPAGLGRVTVVAFDLDQRPFAGWKGRHEFLLSLLDQAWPRQQVLTTMPQEDYGWSHRNNSTLLATLAGDMENFEEVPVISFGWVALFIFIYILIVGPLDYWFLKKVVKRLELTWITFPTVVVLLSVIAYVTAYQIKGKDLRLRKLDLVDVDLRTQQAYGRTWLTIFSPRIDYYTIGLQPALAKADGSVTLSWLAGPVRVHDTPRGQSIFRRAYDYAPNATGLVKMPISVWSSRSVTSSWAQSLRGEPLVSADLSHPADNPAKLTGTITWRPGATDAQLSPRDAHLIYRGRVYTFPLTVGQPVAVDLEAKEGGTPIGDWSESGVGSEQYMNSILFYRELAGGRGRTNDGLRELDQSWRLAEELDEAILLVHMNPRQGPAQEVNQHPATPSRLWLGALPGGNDPQPDLVGILRQDTWVRVFIPIAR